MSSLGLLLLLTACAPSAERPPVAALAPPPSAGVPPPPETPRDALRAFYAGWDAELPRLAPPPPPLPDAIDTLVLGSCLHQERPAPIFAAMGAVDADAAIFLGDNVYGDMRGGDVTLPELRKAYTTLAEHPEAAPYFASTPLMVTWDDHDYGLDDAGAAFAAAPLAERIFEGFWHLSKDDPARAHEGVYAAHTFGEGAQRVQVLLLDTRSFRGPLTPTDERNAVGKERYMPSEADVPLLGPVQWAWLWKQLEEPAALRLVVSSIQVHADGHGWERWGLLPQERDRLYDALAKRNGGQVVLITGDRHRAGIYARPDLDGGPYPELTTSSLNLAFDGKEEPGPHRLGPTFTGENFGVLRIDWAAGQVQLEVRDARGEAVLGHTVPLTL